jgi:hypothetical protein
MGFGQRRRRAPIDEIRKPREAAPRRFIHRRITASDISQTGGVCRAAISTLRAGLPRHQRQQQKRGQCKTPWAP